MFTIFRVKTDATTPDRATCAAAMRWFPFVGVLLALLAELASLAFWRPALSDDGASFGLGLPGDFVGACGSPFLAAVTVVSVLAIFTRGLHLDGLADVADGLGSGQPSQEALTIMKRSDIGPFGVVTLLLVLLAQVAALTYLFASGTMRMCLAMVVIATMSSRLAVLHACATSVPSARPEGFGALVASSATRRDLVKTDILVGLAVVGLCFASAVSYRGAVVLIAGAVAAVVMGWLVTRACIGRFGGVTGDVFGAVAESSMTAALLTVAFAATWVSSW
jgi:adenosylcobinamide-GDP ribazoletransferase